MGIQFRPPQKGGRAPSPIFGPSLLWPNCWMDQGGTWHGGRPWFRPHCARWGHSTPPQKDTEPPILAHVYCGQTAGWIKTPLGTEVDLGPGHFVLDGFPAIGERGAAAHPLFGPCLCHGRPSQLLLSSCISRVPQCYCYHIHAEDEDDLSLVCIRSSINAMVVAFVVIVVTFENPAYLRAVYSVYGSTL